MLRIKYKDDTRLYSNILISHTLCIVLTIIILSAALYMNFEEIGLNLIYTSMKSKLRHITYSAEEINENARNLCLQIWFDRDIQKILYNLPENVSELDNALNRLSLYKTANILTNSIYIFNSSGNVVFTSRSGDGIPGRDSFYDDEIVMLLDNFGAYEKLKPIPRKLKYVYPVESEHQFTNVYSYVYFEITENTAVQDAVVVNVSAKWMKDNILSINNENLEDMIIADYSGKVVNSKEDLFLKSIADENYFKLIKQSYKDSGNFIETVNGIKTVITFTRSATMEWIFISFTPLSSISGEIDRTKHVTFMIGFIIFALGVLGSLIISKRLYVPITRVLKKLNMLEEELRNNLCKNRMDFLRSILIGENESSIQGIINKFKELDIKIEHDSNIIVLLIKIDRYKEFCAKYNSSERALYKFSILNIASEIMTGMISNTGTDILEDNLALVISWGKNKNISEYINLKEKAKLMQNIASKYLDLTISVVISNIGENICEAAELYSSVLEASCYRIFTGYESVIFVKDIEQKNRLIYNYPYDKEKMLIDSLMLGREEDVKKQYIEIIEHLGNNSFTGFSLAILQLFASIKSAIETVENNGKFSFGLNLSSIAIKINKVETIEELNHIFNYIFQSFIEKLENRKNSKYKDLMASITEIVNNQYSNPNLSIDMIAEEVKMSPVYLGRLFKKLTSKSLPSYINEVRIEKAKNLMLTTNFSINEIVEKTGIMNVTYFYTLFKKMHGITPNEFKHRAGANASATERS